MQKKMFVYIGIAIIAVSIVTGVGLTLNNGGEKQSNFSLPELEFTYNESNLKLKYAIG